MSNEKRAYGWDIDPETGHETLVEATLHDDGVIHVDVVRLAAVRTTDDE